MAQIAAPQPKHAKSASPRHAKGHGRHVSPVSRTQRYFSGSRGAHAQSPGVPPPKPPPERRQHTMAKVAAAYELGHRNLPSKHGEKLSSTGALEAEFIGALLILFITLFTDKNSSYSDKMLAIMKRATLLTMLFFLLGLVSGLGENAGRAAKAFGALIVVGVLFSVVSGDVITEWDNFIKGAWHSAGGGDSSASAPAGQPGNPLDSAPGEVWHALTHGIQDVPGDIIKVIKGALP